MPVPPAVKPYRWLATYYDRIFSPLRGPIDTARESILVDVIPDAETACDVACGTGTTAISLARRGIRTYALDISPYMCRIAARKAKGSGPLLKVMRADMRSFRLPEQVDLIICECDALNHIPRTSDLRSVARCVFRALKPGGHFFFDVNHWRGFERYFAGDVWFEKDGVVMVMRNKNDAETRKAWSDVEWFIRDGSGWRRRSERVEEVCWDRAEVRSVLAQAGFGTLRAWDAARFFAPMKHVSTGESLMKPGCRSFYLARKPAR